ncbi:MAG TPA: glycoside hydrolase domain-containing protein, partial [Bacteroidota bacterium]
IPALIGLFGGRDQFADRLDECFARGLFTINNEPDIAYPYLFTYLPGKEKRTDELVRQIREKDFGVGPGGLPGNDDTGTISGWLVFSALGLYPACPASGTYQLCAPLFPRASIRLDPAYYRGRTLTIERSGTPSASEKLEFVELNGKRLPGRSVEHAALANGGTLRFVFSR